MIRRAFAWGGFLLVALAAALYVLPARWLAVAVPKSWPLSLVNAQGSFWRGSAGVALGPDHQQRLLPAPLHWRWSFQHGPRVHLEHPWLNGPLVLALSHTGITVSSQTLKLPATALATLDARLAAIGPQGVLNVHWPTIHGNWSTPEKGTRLIEAEWQDAASALTPVRPLGHYALSVTAAEPGVLDLQLKSLEGPLLLQGKGMLAGAEGLRFDGSAQADSQADASVQAAMQDLLTALGPRRNNVTLLRYR